MGKAITKMNPAKRRFLLLLEKQGFRSINQFSDAVGMSSGNVHLNLSGVHGLSIERAFRYANVLGVPVDEVIYAFHHEEMIENRRAVEEFNNRNKEPRDFMDERKG